MHVIRTSSRSAYKCKKAHYGCSAIFRIYVCSPAQLLTEPGTINLHHLTLISTRGHKRFCVRFTRAVVHNTVWLQYRRPGGELLVRISAGPDCGTTGLYRCAAAGVFPIPTDGARTTTMYTG